MEEEGRKSRDRRKNGNKGISEAIANISNCRSEDEQLPVIATPGKLLVLRSMTGTYQLTGPTGRVVGLQRGVIVTVPFLGPIRGASDRGEGGGDHGSRGAEIEIDEAGWNPRFGGGTFSPWPVRFTGKVSLVMGTRSIIGLVLLNGARSGVTALRSVRHLR